MTKYKKHLLTAAILIVAVFFIAPTAAATGLMDDTVNDAYSFSRYPIGHYALDLYIDPDAGGGFLGIRLPDVSRILFSITNAIWELCVFLASAVGSVVQEAFQLDFLSRATEDVGRNIQQIAGVSESGFSSTGFLPMLLPLAVLAMGAYVLYVGIFKREMTKALGAVTNFLVIFVLAIGFIAFAPSYIQAINSLSVDLSDGALRITNSILNPAANDTDMAVAGIREALHQVQIHAPWQLLQFGSLDIDPARVHELLSYAPHTEGRIDVVIREVEVYGNLHLGGEVDRFGTVLILFFINLGISIFVLSLTGLMIFSQLLLIFYLTLLPIALVLSLFPTFSGMARRSIERVFNTLLLRVGYTLIITIAFSLSLLVYRVSSELSMPFLLVGFLQILVFWGVHKKQDELLGMLSLQSGENHRGERSALRAGRNLGRKALAFGSGIMAGKFISRRRSQQGANVPPSNSGSGAETQTQNTETPPPVERQNAQHEPPQNVDVLPQSRGQSQSTSPQEQVRSQSQPQAQAQPIQRTTFGGRVGHSIGKLVDTPSKVKDSVTMTAEKVQSVPVHAKHSMAQNVQQFRQNLSGTPKERREVRQDQRKQYRDNVELKRSFGKPTKPPSVDMERQVPKQAPAQPEEPRANVPLEPRYAPPKSNQTFKLNGKPMTREQLDKQGDPRPKRRGRRKKRDQEGQV